MGAALGGLSPVEAEGLFDSLQKLARDFLDFFALFFAQVGTGTGEKIEEGQLRVGEVFADVALLFFVQAAAEGNQILEELLDGPAAGVVGLDQLFELRQVIRTRFRSAGSICRVGLESRPSTRPKSIADDACGTESCRSRSPSSKSYWLWYAPAAIRWRLESESHRAVYTLAMTPLLRGHREYRA